MVDKLILLSDCLESRFESLALEDGEKKDGYAGVIDLRKTIHSISARLSCRGFYNGIHKLDFIEVSCLGLPFVLETTRKVFGKSHSAKICRIDLCVDFLGTSVEFFVANCLIPGVQNYKIYRTRGALSYYFNVSNTRTTLVYNKLAELRARQNPLVHLYSPADTLTRFEVQLKGAGVPFKRLSNIHLYAKQDLLSNLQWLRLCTEPQPTKPLLFLAQTGLRSLIEVHGLQRVSKMFSAPVWASIRAQYLAPMKNRDRPQLNTRLQKSVQDWIDGKIRFPRVRSEGVNS